MSPAPNGAWMLVTIAETGEVKGHHLYATVGTCEEREE